MTQQFHCDLQPTLQNTISTVPLLQWLNHWTRVLRMKNFLYFKIGYRVHTSDLIQQITLGPTNIRQKYGRVWFKLVWLWDHVNRMIIPPCKQSYHMISMLPKQLTVLPWPTEFHSWFLLGHKFRTINPCKISCQNNFVGSDLTNLVQLPVWSVSPSWKPPFCGGNLPQIKPRS